MKKQKNRCGPVIAGGDQVFRNFCKYTTSTRITIIIWLQLSVLGLVEKKKKREDLTFRHLYTMVM